MNQIRFFARSALVMAVATQAASCALDTGARIRVSMPGSSSSQNLISFATSPGAFNTDLPAPASYLDFHCFGLNVTGPNIPRSPICSSDPNAGALGGFAPFSGGTVDVRVQPGSSRRIQLLGVVTQDMSCPLLATMNPGDENGPEISAFLLGETTTDVFEDKRVSIQAAYTDAASAIRVLDQCGDGESGGGGGGMPNPMWYSSFMGFWLDASADATAGPIGSWVSSSTNPFTAAQGTGANQPSRMIDAAGPGKHLVQFANVDHNMFTSQTQPQLDNPSAITAFMVVKIPPSPPTASNLFSLNYAGTQTLILSMAVSTGAVTATGTSLAADTETTPPLADNTLKLLQVNWTPGTGNGITLRVNGGALIDANATVNSSAIVSTVSGTTIGGTGSPTGSSRSIGDLVLYGTAFGPDEREKLECYFKGKYLIMGITNPQCP